MSEKVPEKLTMEQFLQQNFADHILNFNSDEIIPILQELNVPYKDQQAFSDEIEKCLSKTLDKRFEKAILHIKNGCRENIEELVEAVEQEKSEVELEAEKLRKVEEDAIRAILLLENEMKARVKNMNSML